MPLNDLHLLSEKPSEASKRIFKSTGLRVVKPENQSTFFTTKEPINNAHKSLLSKKGN